MRVKVCGITRPADAQFAARLGADFIGLVLAPSPRQVPLDVAAGIARSLPSPTTAVLLFQDAPVDEICAAVEATGVRWVQLHGDEPPAYVRQVLDRCGPVSLVRGWSVASRRAGEELQAYLRASATHGVVFRAVIVDAPKGGVHPGYEMLGAVSRHCAALAQEIWCAGGLTVENLEQAVRVGRYAGVDVARGVERSPGVKDAGLLERFIALAKSLSEDL